MTSAVLTDPVTGIPLELLEGLNPEQRDAVSTLTGPLLVVAGPGSGKTRVLVHRIAALLATGTWASQILAVTFTNKAAAEMRHRVGSLVGGETADRMWIATFHSACVRILRYNHEHAGLPRSFSIADAKDAAKLISDCLAALGHTDGLNPSETKQLVRDMHSRISRAKNDNKTSTDLAASRFPDDKLAAQVMDAYNQRLAQLGAVDFDDILLHTLRLFGQHPEVAAKYRDRFAHVLVDEYQDTNAVQYEILRIVGGPSATSGGSVCVVGDADQSIYAFRGANPTVVTAFTADYPGAKVVTLGENYRSTQRIVAVAQAVIDPNPAVHRAELRTSNPVGDKVRLYEADNNFAEAEWVVSQIRARGGANSDHAVLVRTNALTRALEQELMKYRIDHQVVGALRFYDRAEVKDALAYLRLVVNPADQMAFARCVNVPKRGIGDQTVNAVLEEALTTGRTPVEVLGDRAVGGSAAAAKARGFLDAYGAVVSAAGQGPADALVAVADVAGMRAMLQAASAKEGLDREGNLDELISYATQFVKNGSATDPEARVIGTLPGWEQTEAFMENVALVSAAETATGDDVDETGKVSLLTMHAAKGKEYPHVYVVGLEDNVCPHSRALNSGQASELEEERRLLFVAVSRARETLDLSYCRRRVAFQKEMYNAPSRFLADLPADVAFAAGPAQRPPGGGFGGRGVFPGGRGSGGRGGGGYATSRTPATGAGAGAGAGAATATVRRPVPKPAGPRLKAADLSVGITIRHTMLGEGTVTAFDSSTVTVAFPAGSKMLALEIAPLELAG